MFKSWYQLNIGCDGKCLSLIVEREHSSSHQKPILGPVGYVQKLIPFKCWSWQKLADSHCWKGPLLISLKIHIRTSRVCSKVDTSWKVGCDRKCLILIVEREHSSFHQWGIPIQQSPTTAFIHVGTEVAGYRRQQLSSPISQLQCCEHNNIWHQYMTLFQKQNQQGIPYFVLPCS
jgi:hypothetical protein